MHLKAGGGTFFFRGMPISESEVTRVNQLLSSLIGENRSFDGCFRHIDLGDVTPALLTAYQHVDPSRQKYRIEMRTEPRTSNRMLRIFHRS